MSRKARIKTLDEYVKQIVNYYEESELDPKQIKKYIQLMFKTAFSYQYSSFGVLSSKIPFIIRLLQNHDIEFDNKSRVTADIVIKHLIDNEHKLRKRKRTSK